MYGIGDATFYNWRSRYGGMEISDARRLKALDDENCRPKTLPAESMLTAPSSGALPATKAPMTPDALILAAGHEMIFVWKHGSAPHTNNFELSQHGRTWSNLAAPF